MTTDSFPKIKWLPAALLLTGLLFTGTLFSLAWIALPLVAWAGPWGCHW